MKDPEGKMRAALYIRVSTEEQARHGLSLSDQRVALESYAKSHDMAVVGLYEDAGISARKPYKKRPALLRLLDDVKAKKIDIVLFIKLDRWFRNVGNYYAVQEILEQNNVVWQATNEDYETQTAAGRLKVNIMLSVAQDEADRTSERIKFTFEGKRLRGEAISGTVSVGYKIENKRIVKDPETEEAITAFFQKYLACGSVFQAQDHLRLEYGIALEYQRVSDMLRRPVYYGCCYGIEGYCPSYITKEEFERIQSMRHRVTRRSPKNRIYLFSGLMRCGECGASLGARTETTGGVRFYNCPVRYNRNGSCSNNRNISERKVECYLLDTVEAKMESMRHEISKLQTVGASKDYSSEIQLLRAKISRLKDLYLNDLISIDEYKSDKFSMEAKIADLEKKQEPPAFPNFPALQHILSDGWRQLYSELSVEDKREFWRIIIKEIRWYPDRHIEYDLSV